MTQSLKKLALKGTFWTIVGYGSSQTVRFLSNVVLTRLLLPEYFGLMALVNTFRQALSLFTDIGISQNIVRSERGDDPDFMNTAWTIQVYRGFFLWALFILLGWPAARFYEEPRLFQILCVISFTVIAGGFSSIKLQTFKRHMALGKVTAFELSCQLIAVGTMIILALIYPSVWCLVIGALVGQTFRAFASYMFFPGHKHKLKVEPEAKKEIISFGRWIFLTSIVMFTAEQSDRLILGKLIPLEILGVYSIAYVFSNIPQQVMRNISYNVIFPVVSKQLDLPRTQLRKKIAKQSFKLHLVLIVVLSGMVGFGDLIIQLLYDERYYQATWMMPILAMGGWFSSLFFIAHPCLLAIGKPVYGVQSRVFRLLTVTLGIVIGFRFFGILGAVVSVAFGDLPSYISIQYGLYKENLSCFFQDLRSTMILIVVIALIFLLRVYSGIGLPFDALPY